MTKFGVFAFAAMAMASLAFADVPVDILDPAALQTLDRPGLYSLATLLGTPQAQTLAELTAAGNPKYATIIKSITQDILDIESTSGRKMAFSSEEAEAKVPGGNIERHFDQYWLSSNMANFALIAVVNRIDKRDFYYGTCGELRFIYRLAYHRGAVSRSTLPVFLNVVFEYPMDGSGHCYATAQNWLANPTATAQGLKIKQIELNMQIVRFPSGQKADFGGQAIYLFRIFQDQNGSFVSIPLENTPNVAEVLNSPALRASLVHQLTDPANLPKIDQGTFILSNTDGKLLATRALSFSTAGRGRLGNKPFSTIFGADGGELANVDFKNLQFIRSGPALVERLNNNSCIGCHQNGGTAGFHMLGQTGNLNSPFNQVILPFSPHYHAERVRRATYLSQLAVGKEASAFRPPSFFPPADWAKSEPVFKDAEDRALCLLNKNDFANTFSCRAGTQCVQTVENMALGLQIGECVPVPDDTAGHVCRVGTITNASVDVSAGDLYNLSSITDSIDIHHKLTPDDVDCGNPQGGVPLGRISRACTSQSDVGKLTFVEQISPGNLAALPPEMCAMRGGPQFDECAKTSNPPDCLAKARIVRSLLDTCYEGHFCREDYICQKLPNDVSRLYTGFEKSLMTSRIQRLAAAGVGFCVPNYFVFNMRSDGHVIPEGRLAHPGAP